MQLKIIVNIENSAFGDTHYERGVEIARILRELAGRLEDENRTTTETIATRGPLALRDANGNRVGFACLEPSNAEKRLEARLAAKP